MIIRRVIQNIQPRMISSLSSIASGLGDKKVFTPLENFGKIDANKSSLKDKIITDKGLKKYMSDIYVKSGGGFGASLGIGVTAPVLLSSLPISGSLLVGGWVANIGLSFYSIYKMSKLNTRTIEKEDGFYEENNQDKERWYKIFCLSNGLMIAPIVGITLATNPVVIPLATVATLSTFGGATYAALKQTDTNLVSYQGPLIGCVWGLIGTGVFQMFAAMMGYTSIANTMDIMTSLASVGVFTALVAVDTQVAIEDYGNKKLDSINVSTQLLLDATNLFIDFIKLLNRLTGNNDD
jgi:hypothetical protein